jgi:hypothetical protein
MMGNSYPDNLPSRSYEGDAATSKWAISPAFGSASPANRRQKNAQRLFGREGEQPRLRQLLDTAIGGSGNLLLIGGGLELARRRSPPPSSTKLMAMDGQRDLRSALR